MIKLVNKTIFNVDADAIINTVNCVGVMGAGIALECSLRYPELLELYKKDCSSHKVKLGELIMYDINGKKIINFPTKFHWKYPSKIEWIEDGLDYLIKNYQNYKIKSIAIPPLGCQNGGLNFKKEVFPLLVSKLKNVKIDVYICLDPGYPEGKEKEMVDKFKSSNLEEVCFNLKIRNKEYSNLIGIKSNINRFFDIKNKNGIGISTYKKLFSYFYRDEREFQASLF